MKNMKSVLISIWLVICIGMTANVVASENTRQYLDGIRNYNSGEFEQAAKVFEKTAEKRVRNGKLFYNLGNAYFKSGDIGKSIVWYERALKMIPNDPDLKFNYQYVKSFVKDKSDDSTSAVVEVLFFWKDILGQPAIKWLAVSFFFLFWLLVIIQMFKGRKLIRMHTGILLSIAAIFVLTASYDYYSQEYKKEAVILPEKISIRSGLTDDSTELFILHVGTKVLVEENRKDHVKIRFSGDKIGWISKESIEII